MSEDGILNMQPDGDFQRRGDDGRYREKDNPAGIQEVRGAPAPHLDTSPPEIAIHTPDKGEVLLDATGTEKAVPNHQAPVQSAADVDG